MDNSYELVSNTSECTSSNFSSLSLPTYDECCDLKPNTPLLPFYKSDLHEVKNFHKLLQYNTQLESQLAVANNFINSLVSKSSKDAKLETVGYIKSNYELNSKLGLLQNDLKAVKSEMETNGSLISSLKREIEKRDVDICIKGNSVSGLKNKIVELHLEIQGLKQKDMKVNNTLVRLTNELTSVRKSEQWYKNALYECREQKLTQTEELLKLQSSLSTKIKDFEVLKTEMLSLQCKYNELKGCSRQIVESLSKQIQSNSVTSSENAKVDRTKIIEDLNTELEILKNDLDDSKFLLQSASKQNIILMSQNASLQKYLDEKTTLITAFENCKLELNSKVNHLTRKLQENEEVLLNSHKEKLELQTILFSANQEKWEITEGITAIRNNFAKFIIKYKRLKENLLEKDGQISNLNEQFLKDKTNNLKELKELKGNLKDYCQLFSKLEEDCTEKQEFNEEIITSLESKIELLDETNSRYIFQMEKLCQELKMTKDNLSLFEKKAGKLEVDNLRLISRGKMAKEEVQLNSKMAQEKLIEENHNLQITIDHIQQLNLTFETKIANLQNMIEGFEEINNNHVNQIEKLQKENFLLQSKVEELSQTFTVPKYDTFVPTLQKSLSLHCMSSHNEPLVELQRLKTVLKAKVMENKENHKRYETNNRTLLNNIKDYRNENRLSQKRFEELQTNYGQLLEELNTFKNENVKKDEEISSLKSLCNDYKTFHFNHETVEIKTKYQKQVESLEIENLQIELDTANSDKYFLQRLCKDLKFSLQTNTLQAMDLRKQIQLLTTKKLDFKNKIPSPSSIDDTKILKLLQQSSTVENPFNDLECCMGKFKENIVCLQNEILQAFI